MKKTLLVALLLAAACDDSKPRTTVSGSERASQGETAAPADTSSVSFEANGAAAVKGDGEEVASASYMMGPGVLTIYLYGAVPPDKQRRQMSIQVTGYRGNEGDVAVAAAVYTRKDEQGREYGYQAKANALKLKITELELEDVPGSPLKEGTISGTFEGDMQYPYPKKEGNPFTEPLKITNGKFSGVKVSGMK